jgi:PPOX class probable F420-dependent enzyme
MKTAPTTVQSRLETEHNVWLVSVRPDGRPHLVPVWFAWHDGKLYVCIEPESVKGRNIRQNPRLALALENGSTPVICEGTAAPVSAPWPEAVRAVFQQKYDWDIFSDAQYTQLLEVMPEKWLVW